MNNSLWMNTSFIQIEISLIANCYLLKGIIINASLSRNWQSSNHHEDLLHHSKLISGKQTDDLPSIVPYPNCWWLIPYPLRDCYGTAHQVEPSPWQVFTANLGAQGLTAPPNNYPTNTQRSSRSKGYWVTTCSQIQGCIKDHVGSGDTWWLNSLLI
jgi:hypothetical protein